MAKSSRPKVSKKKGGRPEREKKKDFVKSKQKVGKRLLKPQNETITTFKSRAIQIREQLAEKTAGPTVTKKRYSMMELVSRFQNSNPNQKLDACGGVKELLSKITAEQVEHDLSPLLSALSRCLLEDDPKVRATGIKLIEAVIEKVGCDSLAPHFSPLGNHLTCGLVSLHSDIQASSLNTLHLLSRIAPQLLHLHANTLVPNLLRLLGAKTKSGEVLQKVFTRSIGGQFKIPSKKNKKAVATSSLSAGTKPGGKNAEMIVAVGSKQLALVWQLDVCTLLTAMLRQISRDCLPDVAKGPKSAWELMLSGASPGDSSDVRGSSERFVMLTHPDKLKEFCTVLLPRLHSLFCNMLPENTKLKGGVTMSNHSAHSLWCLVDLERVLTAMVETCLGTESTKCAWFAELIKPVFSDILVNHFPFHYVQEENVRQGRKKSSKTPLQQRYDHNPLRSSDDLNVLMATVGVKFGILTRKRNLYLSDYVEELLQSTSEIGTYNMDRVCDLMVGLIDFFSSTEDTSTPSTPTNKKRKLDEIEPVKVDAAIDRLLQAALAAYKTMHPLKKEKRTFLSMLLRVTDPDHRHIHNAPSIRDWSSYIVSELRDQSLLPLTLFEAAQQVCLRRCPGVGPFDTQTINIIDENLQKNAASDVEERHKKIIIRLLAKA